MKYDFDYVPDRRNSGSYKWDLADKSHFDAGAYPFSVADMEFQTPIEIRTAVADFAEKGFFCYTGIDDEYKKAVCSFMKRHHNWNIQPESIVPTGGVVFAINTAIRAFTNVGDGVIIQRPVYYPFTDSIVNNGRVVKNNALLCDNKGNYSMNFEELEFLASEPDTKLMLLCSPHNPVGRVWTVDELKKVADICQRNHVILVSDEIHMDLCRNKHTVINTVDKNIAGNTVNCTAVSKSFNVAGLSTSNIIIENDMLRKKFSEQTSIDGYSCINCVSRPVTITAYTECDGWLEAVNNKINENFDLLEEFISSKHPEIILSKREGTYLAWLNFKFMNISDEELNNFLIYKAGIIPDPGFWFGPEGSGYTRLNLAVPTKVLGDALNKLDSVI